MIVRYHASDSPELARIREESAELERKSREAAKTWPELARRWEQVDRDNAALRELADKLGVRR